MDPLHNDTFTRSAKPPGPKASAFGDQGPYLAASKLEPFKIWKAHQLALDCEISALQEMLGQLANGKSVAQLVAQFVAPRQQKYAEAGSEPPSLRPRPADPQVEKIVNLLANRVRTPEDRSATRALMEQHLQLQSQRSIRYQALTSNPPPKLTTAEELRSCSGAAEIHAPKGWTREPSASGR
jgi:hypothetical protein